MIKTEPRFAINEAVMVRSVIMPEFNRDNIGITERKWATTQDIKTGRAVTGWKYWLDDPLIFLWANEESLRPRPQPATKPFEVLMENIRSIEPVGV